MGHVRDRHLVATYLGSATEHCPGRNRSKIMGVGTASFWIVASAFDNGVGKALIYAGAVTFTLPYLYSVRHFHRFTAGADDSGSRRSKLGTQDRRTPLRFSPFLTTQYFYAGGCLLSLLFVMFYIGETRGRTLEECASPACHSPLTVQDQRALRQARARSQVEGLRHRRRDTLGRSLPARPRQRGLAAPGRQEARAQRGARRGRLSLSVAVCAVYAN